MSIGLLLAALAVTNISTVAALAGRLSLGK